MGGSVSKLETLWSFQTIYGLLKTEGPTKLTGWMAIENLGVTLGGRGSGFPLPFQRRSEILSPPGWLCLTALPGHLIACLPFLICQIYLHTPWLKFAELPQRLWYPNNNVQELDSRREPGGIRACRELISHNEHSQPPQGLTFLAHTNHIRHECRRP